MKVVMTCKQLSLKNPDLTAEIIRVFEKHGIKSPSQPAHPIQAVFHKPVQLITQKEKQEEESFQQTQKKSQFVTVQKALQAPMEIPTIVTNNQVPMQQPQPIIIQQQQLVIKIQQYPQILIIKNKNIFFLQYLIKIIERQQSKLILQ